MTKKTRDAAPGRIAWKPGTMVYPVPAVLVTSGTMDRCNVCTVSWTGTVCTDPAMTYISLRPDRHSHGIISAAGEFVINLTTRRLAFAADFCGVKSGRDTDKLAVLGLAAVPSAHVAAPSLGESPVCIECRVTETIPLGSHHMFLARVLGVTADRKYLDKKGRFNLQAAEPICYSHGEYFSLGKRIGRFGFSVKKGRQKQTTRG
jgi:flavin reductase (DIM6/NTAB) family NADH-FMN oxidoreductase RutF